MGTISRLFRQGGQAITRGPRRFGACVAAALFAALAVAGAGAATTTTTTPNAATTSGPHVGGAATIAATNLGVLDPDAPGAWPQNTAVSGAILGSLFFPPASPGGQPTSDLASAYRFTSGGTVLSITLRKGATFSDGTPVNAKAVVWNLRRVASSASPTSALLSAVKNVAVSGSGGVTITFSAADYAFVDACAESSLCDLASPSAFARMGATAFAAAPVGAGPYKVASAGSSRVVLTRNPSYWDARHSYLTRWTLIAPGVDPALSYDSVIQDTVQVAAFPAVTTEPLVLYRALANHNVQSRVTPDLNYGFVPLDAAKAPFSDQRAREAIDYCTNRSAIANGVLSGYASPAYVLAGSSSSYLPRPGGVRGEETLMPYKYNVAQSQALVAQLGGLSFTLEVAADPESEAVANALAAQWANCNMHATVVDVTSSQLNSDLGSGTFQAGYVVAPGKPNPTTSMAYESPVAPIELPGLNDSKLPLLVAAAGSASTASRLAAAWREIWFQENTDAIDIPIVSSGVMVVSSHCLRDVAWASGISLVHAWLVCPD